MTIIHMDVDSCRYSRRQMNELRKELSTYANRLIQNAQTVVDRAWMAQGAEQYLSELTAWDADLMKLLGQLDHLSRQLDSEISEWLRASREND